MGQILNINYANGGSTTNQYADKDKAEFVANADLSVGPQPPALSQAVTLANDLTFGAAASVAAVNVDLLTGTVNGWYDASNFHSVAIQIVGGAGISAGQIIFEQTNDITAAASGNVWAVDENTTLTPTPSVAALAIAASTIRMFGGPVMARYVRVRVSTAFVGGTVQAIAAFSQLPYMRMIQSVHQAAAANLNATATLAAGTALAGGVGVRPEATLGLLLNHRLAASAATTNPTLVLTGARKLFGGIVRNNAATSRFLKFYNKATAPAPGTDVPVLTIEVKTGEQLNITPYLPENIGMPFSLGLGYGITGALADADATAIAAGDVMLHLFYI